MRLVSCLAAWGPYDEQKDTLDYSDTLESGFSICFSDVFAGQKVTVKEEFQVSKVNAVNVEIDLPLGFVPGDHAL